MRNRLVQALQALGPHISEKGLSGIPDSILALVGRISPEDFHIMYVLLMKYPNISAEWVIRGNGEMLIDEDPIEALRAENEELRRELERERQKVRYLEMKNL
ncbi:MAG: hypothetical protein BGO21_21240 [Dyadobacter sp. 50-39]|uniref:hypothetical protein n=1 Tax=Dyadobacter sp. 50-39 TaxID=1895756 RepID=UPI00095D9E37|nr:hypothetical protein [Dyadobacter sp. 50-39]OJV19221.1 MAG: hypothetical protein BGO21_21240 [Dyadobacter sp. 50-39]